MKAADSARDPAAQAVAAAVLLTGGEGALGLLDGDLGARASELLAELVALDRIRRVAAVGRALPAALRPAPAPHSETLAEAQGGVPALGPTLQTLGLPVPGATAVRGPRGPSRDVLAAVGAALGPAGGPVPSWCPPVEGVAACGVRLLARAVGDLDAKAAAHLCGRLDPAEAQTLVTLWRAGLEGDFAVARRILAAAARDVEPPSLALRAGATRIGWALGPSHDAPAGWPRSLVDAIRRGQSAAALSAPPGDAASERHALSAEAA